MSEKKNIGLILCMLIFFIGFNGFPLFFKGAWSGYSDEDSYLAHALTLGLDFDLDYSNEPIQGLNPYGTSPKHSIGPGIFTIPFVFSGSILDRITHHPIIQDHKDFVGSFSLASIFFAKIFYFFGGLLLFIKGIQLVFTNSKKNVPADFVLFAGSGILYYVLINTIKTHVFEFFSLAVIFYFSISYCLDIVKNQQRKLWKLMLTQVGVALAVLNRNSYVNTLLLLPIFLEFFIITTNTQTERIKIYLQQGACFAIAYIPSAILNLKFYNKIYPSIYDMYGLKIITMEFSSDPLLNKAILLFQTFKKLPYLLHIFFSMEFGLLYTSPIILAGIFASFYFFYTFRKAKNLAYFILLICMFWGSTLAVPLWWLHPGMDYGWRYIFSLLPLSALMLYWFMLSGGAEKIKNIFKKIIIALSCFSIFAQLIFGTIPDLTLKDTVFELGYIEGAGSTHYVAEVVEHGLQPKALMGLLSLRSFPFIIEIPCKIFKMKFDSFLNLLPINVDTFYSRAGKDVYALMDSARVASLLQWAFLFLAWILLLKLLNRFSEKN